jgi:ATP/maltotriose-dependent transcriptional regulator MalT
VSEFCLTSFSVPFTQLWRGAIDEAERGMREVLEDTVRLGDAERNLLCLVYLAVVFRQRGDVDSAEAFATAAIARARANRALHYEAVSQGTLAWVAWRRGDGGRADQLVDLARQTTIPLYPFMWIFAAVGLVRGVERDDIEAAKAMVARMLEPSHQLLDEDVEATLVKARDAPSAAKMRAAVDACRRIRYL